MKAMILAAGLGTRLKPWTLSHPKALVPVGGVPMLRRVIERLISEGFDDIVVNVHHFADQICEFLSDNDFGVEIRVSNESDMLLDTGGALLKAAPLIFDSDAPCLVHNVDILSDAPLSDIVNSHLSSNNDITLLTSGRESSRKLIFDGVGALQGWHNLSSGEFRPDGFTFGRNMHESAFSGIYVVSPKIIDELREYSKSVGSAKFPIMDFLLNSDRRCSVEEFRYDNLKLIDIGKPDTLEKANYFIELGG